MSEVTIEQLMQALPDFFVPERAAGADSTIFFQLSGPQGGNWVVRFLDRTIDVQRGESARPDLTLQADGQDVLDIFTGKLDPMSAYMRGKVRMQGSMGLAMKLSHYFEIDYEKLKALGRE